MFGDECEGDALVVQLEHCMCCGKHQILIFCRHGYGHDCLFSSCTTSWVCVPPLPLRAEQLSISWCMSTI